MDAHDVFPALAGFPEAVTDVADVANDVMALRLVSKAKNVTLLRRLSKLQRLWCFDLNAQSASTIGALVGLRRLYVEGTALPTLSALGGLTNLEVLSLESCTRVGSLEALAPFFGVRALGVTHFPKVHCLKPLTKFESLAALVVAGGMWARMTVASLAPLAQLSGLRYLHLTNLKALDESLEPLGALTELKTLDLPNFYPVEQFAMLSARLTRTGCTWFEPFSPIRSLSCTKCGQANMVMLTGKRMPTLCVSCDEARVRKHAEFFRNVAARAA